MSIDNNYFKELGFIDFIHLRKIERDGKRRMTWVQIVDEEIVTIRIVFFNKEWIVDYVNPEKYNKRITTIKDVINFINQTGAGQ